MKIEFTDGCTTSCIQVDGEDMVDLSPMKMTELKDALIDYLEGRVAGHEDELQSLLLWMVQEFGLTRHEYHCEQCGDDVYTTTLEI